MLDEEKYFKEWMIKYQYEYDNFPVSELMKVYKNDILEEVKKALINDLAYVDCIDQSYFNQGIVTQRNCVRRMINKLKKS